MAHDAQGRKRRVLILPAIDLRGGQCVRLQQGDYARETVFGTDPAAMARRWVEQGAAYLHLVDLDGAREGRPVNGASIRGIVEATGVPCQLGGGLRSDAHVEEALGWGVQRVVVGTRALRDPEWCRSLCQRFPGRIAVGIDARDGLVAVAGWMEASDRSALEWPASAADWAPPPSSTRTSAATACWKGRTSRRRRSWRRRSRCP